MPIETRAKDVVSGRAENEVGRGDSAGSCAPRERADGEQLEGDAARRLALSLGASTVGSLFRTSEEQPGSMESAGRCGSGSRFPVGAPWTAAAAPRASVWRVGFRRGLCFPGPPLPQPRGCTSLSTPAACVASGVGAPPRQAPCRSPLQTPLACFNPVSPFTHHPRCYFLEFFDISVLKCYFFNGDIG